MNKYLYSQVNVPETEDEATIPAYKSSDFVRSMSETDMSMTDYEGFERFVVFTTIYC